MAYDVRADAPGALALGGVGALGGLAYSYLNKKQRNNKLRNALIGATALPATWIGGKYIASKVIDSFKDPREQTFSDPSDVLWLDPVSQHISSPVLRYRYRNGDYPVNKKLDELRDARRVAEDEWIKTLAVAKYESAQNKMDTALNNESKYLTENQDGLKNEEAHLLNTTAALGYGTLGAGITLPALYLAYLNKKKKKQQAEMD